MILRFNFFAFLAAIGVLSACRTPTRAVDVTADLTKSESESVVQDRFKYGHPQYNLIREYEGYVVCYDPRTKNPYWTYEVLKKETLQGSADRESIPFKEDESFPKIHRAKLLDFKNSGYDRGHLAACANNKNSQQSMVDTFLLTNVSPMHQDVNRRLWKGLESWIRENTIKKDTKTYVIAGVLFLPSKSKERSGKLFVEYPVIGSNQVAVPTHFFKAILFEMPDGKIEKKAFLIPNNLTDKKNSFWDFQVTLEKVETLSGLILFRPLPKN